MHINDRARHRPKIKHRAKGHDFKMRPVPRPSLRPRSLAHPDQSPKPSRPHREKGVEHFKTPPLYQAIVAHQRSADWWANHDELVWLRAWARTFIKEFGINVRDAHYLSVPLIKIEPMNVKTLGAFQIDPDGYAIKEAIVLNEKRLKGLPDYMKLALLMKMLIDAWQQQRCPDDLFDEQGRKGFQELGLTVTAEGITIAQGGRFRELLRREKIETPAGEIPWPKPEQMGKSTNSLWSCLCQKVRVGTSTFEAVCLRCHTEFRQGDHVVKNPSPEKGARRRAAAKQAAAGAATRAAGPGVDALSQPAP